jgi:GMP synthase (glutamine-hydrolysing)
MILIISTCADKLSELEFVKPIEQLAGKCRTVHYSQVNKQIIKQADKIIITGTALKDFKYLQHDWSWLKNTDKPVLGICAGMQAIAQAHNIPLQENTIIGPQQVKVIQKNKLAGGDFTAYFLHTKTSSAGFEVLATTNSTPCIIKHQTKELYGCIFHPEVLNPEIITRFVQ